MSCTTSDTTTLPGAFPLIPAGYGISQFAPTRGLAKELHMVASAANVWPSSPPDRLPG